MTLPIKVWLAPPGPNPWKVVLVLEELKVPYEIVSIKFENIKKKPFTDVNPNGRCPAIQDPNTDLTLWESGAIISYLVEVYDKENLISFDSFKEKHLANQWLHFQMSGQGPYWGAAGWFNVLHPEKIPSAIERYNEQVLRVLGVLEGYLAGGEDGEPRDWLVGGRLSYADLAWVPWNDRIDSVINCAPEDKFKGYPRVQAWHERMTSRPSWKKAMEWRAKLMDEQGLMWNGMPKGVSTLEEYEAKIAAGET